MRILVKLGGTLLDGLESRRRIACELASLKDHELVVVHGGGKQMTRFVEEGGVKSTFVNGLRVTTPDVIDAVLKVFAGSVNHELVACLVEAGTLPVGLTGIDACLVEAEQLNADLGQVGKPVRANADLLRLLCSHKYLPVVACVAGDRKGNIDNVNADQMAVACAAGFEAEHLIVLTDVDGVRDGGGPILRTLTPADCGGVIRAGDATGGIAAKPTSATHDISS